MTLDSKSSLENQITRCEKIIGKVWNRIKPVIGLDVRSMALFRIMIALTTIYDCFDRMGDLQAHYSDEGIISRSFVLSSFWNHWWVSIYMMSGLVWFTYFLFFLHILAAFSLLIGYYTTLSTFITWFFVISIQSRNFVVGHGGDVLHRNMLFFAMFVPLGRAFSVDAALALQPQAKRKKKHVTFSSDVAGAFSFDNLFVEGPQYNTEDKLVANVATFALMMQLVCMYVSAHYHKSGLEWTEYGTASWLALQLDYFRKPFGDLLLLFPAACTFLTFAVLKWQKVGTFCLFFPYFVGPLKTFGVTGYWFMHVSFALAFRLDQFAWVTCSAILVLLPSWFWDDLLFKFLRLKNKERTNLQLYCYQNCNSCKHVFQFVKTFLLFDETRLIPYSSLQLLNSEEEIPCQCGNHCNWTDEEKGRGFADSKPRKTHQLDSWMVVKDHSATFRQNWDAVVAVCSASPFLFPFARLLNVKPIKKMGQAILGRIHDHKDFELDELEAASFRTLPHKAFQAKNPTALFEVLWMTWMVFKKLSKNLLVGLFLFLIVTWCFGNFSATNHLGTPPSLKWIVWTAHLDQNWSMFAPRPPDTTWWYSIEATLDNGEKVQLWNGGGIHNLEPVPMTWDKPDPFNIPFKNHRWFKFFEHGYNSHSAREEVRLQFGRWLCREYNKVHSDPERLHTFAVHWMSEQVETAKLDGSRIPKAKVTLWNHICYDKEKERNSVG